VLKRRARSEEDLDDERGTGWSDCLFSVQEGRVIYSHRSLFGGDPDFTMYTRVMSETKETIGRRNIGNAYDKV
jgi:hypothetical protein